MAPSSLVTRPLSFLSALAPAPRSLSSDAQQGAAVQLPPDQTPERGPSWQAAHGVQQRSHASYAQHFGNSPKLVAHSCPQTLIEALMCSFHQIEPQSGGHLVRPHMASSSVVTRPKRSIPFPLLHENTLLLSDCLLVNRVKGSLRLMVRCACAFRVTSMCCVPVESFMPASDRKQHPPLPCCTSTRCC